MWFLWYVPSTPGCFILTVAFLQLCWRDSSETLFFLSNPMPNAVSPNLSSLSNLKLTVLLIFISCNNTSQF
jgi:hypothetical protein